MRFRNPWKIISGTAVAAVVIGGASIQISKLLSGDESFYQTLAMPLLHRLDPEIAHKLAIKCASLGLVPRQSVQDPIELETTVFGHKFSNPIGLAAGFDKQAEAISGLLQMGFGFIEVGSVTPLPQDGNPKPRVFRLSEDRAIINRYGFNSDGCDTVAQKLDKWHKDKGKSSGIVGINLGKNKSSNSPIEDYVKGVQVLGKFADYIVINVSSPNTPGLRALQRKEELQTLIAQVSTEREKLENKPALLIKLAPDLTLQDKQDIAYMILKEKIIISGLILCNTTVKRPSYLTNDSKDEAGGLSGPPLREISTKAIHDMYRLTEGKVPIIGVGGVQSGEDAYEKIRAGASLIQILTVLTYNGPSVIQKIKKDLFLLLRQDGFKSIQEAVGIDHKK